MEPTRRRPGRPRGQHNVSLSATVGNLAIRRVIRFQGGRNPDGRGYKSGVGVRIPENWTKELGLDSGSVVMMSRRGKEIRVFPLDEAKLLEALEATIGDDE